MNKSYLLVVVLACMQLPAYGMLARMRSTVPTRTSASLFRSSPLQTGKFSSLTGPRTCPPSTRPSSLYGGTRQQSSDSGYRQSQGQRDYFDSRPQQIASELKGNVQKRSLWGLLGLGGLFGASQATQEEKTREQDYQDIESEVRDIYAQTIRTRRDARYNIGNDKVDKDEKDANALIYELAEAIGTSMMMAHNIDEDLKGFFHGPNKSEYWKGKVDMALKDATKTLDNILEKYPNVLLKSNVFLEQDFARQASSMLDKASSLKKRLDNYEEKYRNVKANEKDMLIMKKIRTLRETLGNIVDINSPLRRLAQIKHEGYESIHHLMLD